MDMWVFFEVVVPLLELEDTCLIAVTTVMDDDNFYSKLLDIRDENDKPLFHYFLGGLFPITAKVKTGLRGDIGMAPTIQNYARNIPLRVKPGRGKHPGHLLDNLIFIRAIRFTKKLGAP